MNIRAFLGILVALSFACASPAHAAVQVSQSGNFVYVIKNDVAELHPVKVARTLGDVTVLQSGVNDGDAVVVNGHLQLTNGARVAIRAAKKAGS